eukprot:PhF_6_TR14898/c0_g1_i4/m.23243
MNFYHDVLYRMYGTSSCNHIIKSCLITTLFNCVENDSPELLPMDVVMLMLELCIPTAYRLTNEVPIHLSSLFEIGCSTDVLMTVDEEGKMACGVPTQVNHVVFINPGIRVESLHRWHASIPFRVTAFDSEAAFVVKQGTDDLVTVLGFEGIDHCHDPDTPMIVDVYADKAVLWKVVDTCENTRSMIAETKHPWPLTDDDVLIVGFYLFKDACVLRMGLT